MYIWGTDWKIPAGDAAKRALAHSKDFESAEIWNGESFAELIFS